MHPTGLIRIIALKKTLVSLALTGACAFFALPAALRGDSPFLLTVEPVKVTADAIDVRVALSFPDKHVVYADSFRIDAATSGATLERLQMPLPDRKPDFADPLKTVSVYAHPFESVWRLRPPENGVSLHIAYQGCDDTVCFIPEAHTYRFDKGKGRFDKTSREGTKGVGPASDWLAGLQLKTSGGYLSSEDFLAFLDDAEGRTLAPDKTGFGGFLRDPITFFHTHGLVLTLLLVLLGGVLLNLTPCVLPMIPINLAIIGAGAGTRGRGFFLGTAYGAGMVLVYGGLGWVILRSGLFFGALQASPWFSLAVALVFAGLTLAMFDVFVIDFGRLSRFRGGGREGGMAAFTAGALSALLAGACVAPVVLAVLVLAGSLYASGATEAQFLPFVLGLGMALPWPFAGAGLSVLPQPGAWMVRVKQVFGVFLAMLAVYYFSLAGIGFFPASLGAAREGSIAAGDRAAWETKVAQARREGKPIFVDFWATWCKNCSVMEKTTFSNTRVKARLATYVVVRVQAEKPEQEPAKEMLAAFEVRGLPGFAVLK